VQGLDEFFAEQIAPTGERPVLPSRDIFLLGCIQLAPVGDVRGD